MALLARGELRSILQTEMPNALDTRWDTQATDQPEAHGEGQTILLDFDAVVKAEALVEVAHFIRDKFGYTLLSNITAVDYLKQGLIEVVYQFYNAAEGGPDLRVRVRIGRSPEECIVPSLTPTWPGADLQEREAYDMYGVVFPGHPNLARIYMWDEFKGFPMRKDFPKTGDKYTHVTGE
ncbi:MAG TPA: NADH-quinone oxidoreductase subunit C [Herpetosiphon sp.]|uniref:NAD(P)H dehydrogenase subunit J n=1 Tax=Herpetosiphon aurantiacus (strain ATCC 23779 / DSM 785 / 114-95) TaxID=316274 RepID=A9B479_HERA2|nr:NADH-quinone oxidoreductase subunit C [Herpetosiphon sp.]ABX07612.1 NADH (or F420H2) dehydrogenase, subunit C [Herpetosiphon aurantiacus DSM 785]HBW49612.1 NADH-quinone oxidoreductase subunit C [Herpetosiphon sp.]